MLRPSLFWKIFGYSLALIAVTALVAGWIAERRIVDDGERHPIDGRGVAIDDPAQVRLGRPFRLGLGRVDGLHPGIDGHSSCPSAPAGRG